MVTTMAGYIKHNKFEGCAFNTQDSLSGLASNTGLIRAYDDSLILQMDGDELGRACKITGLPYRSGVQYFPQPWASLIVYNWSIK